ncbi:hypothetical protein FJ208_01425 [Candidatus Gribaldobacteria bacterium]|nr:hypothetical protein [Candidatus Gribaldobacteria bacterium]
MEKTISQNSTTTINMPSPIIKAIFEELKLLRKEIACLLPQDELKNYSRPEKIRSAYNKAIKDYPPSAYGNY